MTTESTVVLICPRHGQSDCSPLLNGCTLVVQAHQMRDILRMIAEDMPADIAHFEGALFNGVNVSTMFGNIAAAVASMAEIITETICAVFTAPEIVAAPEDVLDAVTCPGGC